MLLFLTKPGTTYMMISKPAWRAWEQRIAPPRLEQTPQNQYDEVQRKSLWLGLHQPIKEDWDPEGKLSCIY